MHHFKELQMKRRKIKADTLLIVLYALILGILLSYPWFFHHQMEYPTLAALLGIMVFGNVIIGTVHLCKTKAKLWRVVVLIALYLLQIGIYCYTVVVKTDKSLPMSILNIVTIAAIIFPLRGSTNADTSS